MRRFEFILRRNFKEKGWKMLVLFFTFLIPSHVWRLFMALILFSGLLPRDIDRGEEETLLVLTFRRWELYLYDFLTGILLISIAGTFSLALTSTFVTRWYKLNSLLRTLAAAPYLYSISVLMAKTIKSHFVVPLILVIVDEAFWFTSWGYLSPLAQKTPYSLALSITTFAIVFLAYVRPRFVSREEGTW